MRDCLDRIDEYTARQRTTFMTSRLVQDAVVRNLQTLTESSQRLSAAAKALEPSVPWRELSGFRNVIVHGYLGLDLEVIWSVVSRELPALGAALERLAAACVRASGADDPAA
ncbi:MAG: hypothetical protein ABS84_07560 [Rubrivivax sp. SCN 71-131]|jgi:uncharacterized protein with HEPN domain|nr:MAG: hypothetical protein ABS84_07560 [Rubrivivax sp. SCN 71-131]